MHIGGGPQAFVFELASVATHAGQEGHPSNFTVSTEWYSSGQEPRLAHWSCTLS